MPLVFESKAHCAHRAKILKRELAAIFHTAKLSDAQNAIGEMMGYRNWHELEKKGIGGEPSPFDESVDDAERAARRIRQINVLMDRFGLAREAAVHVADKLRATASHLTSVPTKPKWLARFEECASKDELFGGLDQWAKGVLWPKDGKSRHMAEPIFREVDLPGLGTVRYELSPNLNEYEDFKVRMLIAGLLRDGRVVAFVDGYVVSGDCDERAGIADRDPNWEEALYEACDCVEDDIAAVMHAMIRSGDAAHVFEAGNVLIVNGMGRNFQRTQSGEGRHLLSAVFRHINSKHRGGLRSIAFETEPLQFREVEYNKRIATREYKEARAHLVERFVRKAVDKDIAVVDVRTGAASPDLAVRMERMDTQELANENLDPWEITQRNTMRIFSRVPPSSVTRTAPGQPKLAEPEQFPEGFDIYEASSFKAVRVHEKFWDFMPSDVVSVYLEPENQLEECELGERRKVSLTFSFSGGTQLKMPSSFIVGGADIMTPHPDLVGEGNVWILKNPHTDKMSTVDMQLVLAVHAGLLFDGRPGVPGQPISRPVEVRRPEKMPKAV